MKYPFLRFLMVGIINTIVGLSMIFLLFYIFHLSYWIATFFGNIVGGLVSFILNRSFTFQSDKSIKRTIVPFFLVMFICYFVSYNIGKKIAFSFLNITALPILSVHDLAILLGSGLYTITNYFGQKRFVFFTNKKRKVPRVE
jgi:putative flippase GtrA